MRKHYLFGIGRLCDAVLADKTIALDEVSGLFDNEKAGLEKYGIRIQKPEYYSDTEVFITLHKRYHLEALKQLLNLGYLQITIVHQTEQGYERRHYDFSAYHCGQSRDCLIVLYLQHRSYSGISALMYMLEHRYVMLPEGFRVAVLEGNTDETAYYYYAAKADYFITERDRLAVYGKLVQLWHGFPLKALGHMMKSFKTEENRTTNLWQRYDHIASYGQIYTDFMCACYGTHFGQYWVTGMPRNDLLFMTDGKQNLQEILPDSAGKKIIFYMPTFRELEHKKSSWIQVDGDADGYLFYWEDFNIDRLDQFCKEHNLYFVFKLHPSDASKVKTWCVSSDYIGILTDGMLMNKCMYEYLNAADVLITDYSSVYFDYLLLDRPIVFTDRDVNSYAAHRGVILEPLEFWRPGAVVHTMDLLIQELEKALDNQNYYGEERKRLMPLVHRYQDGQSTKRLFEMIETDWKSMQQNERGDR
ncbi:MAG: CDP-glycerol glycerophosphotransferase family protein [Lachnospiraceae bacterium]|nr:CDP-glycerol glycerophosphotransferase family protein [Lachnospiraceae bacterium]